MNYGKAFRELREEKGLSRAEIANRIGCTPSALSKIESGKVRPKEKTIEKFCVMTSTQIARFYTLALTREDFSLISIQRKLLSEDAFSDVSK